MQAVFSRVTDPPTPNPPCVSLFSFPLFGVNKTYTRKKVDPLFLKVMKQNTCIFIPEIKFIEEECATKRSQPRKM